MTYKRAQTDGTRAAVLVAIITLLLIFYILFLPPEEREALLGDEGLDPTTPGIGTPTITERTLLLANIGRLEYYNPQGFDHFVPSINLFAAAEAQVLSSQNPFTVRNGWFDKGTKNITFTVSDLENTDNVLLSFNARQRKGRLKIRLNGISIYEFEISQLNAPPIRLDKELLTERNTLEFSVSGVGPRLWRTNEYSLEVVKIVGDITDLSRQQSRNIFTISSTEKFNMERATLQFYPQCEPSQVGVLEILINNRKVYESIPDCNSINLQELSISDLNAGSNNIAFMARKGNYRIDQILVDTDLREVSSFIDYFELKDKDFEDVLDGTRSVVLEIQFVDDGKKKRAELNINGHLAFLNQQEPVYFRNIDPFVGSGNNYLEIRPAGTLDIVELRVTVE